jgi:uncharacterized protein YbjT (DUF2867 family)
MPKPQILVTAAAGRTGRPTVLQLLAKGYPVRALVRSLDHRAEELRAAGAEVVAGSLADPADLERALRGVRRAYFCPPWGPGLVHLTASFATAAAEARLESVVAMSQWLASPRHPSMTTRGLWLMERTLPWTPGLGVTIVNPGFFADNYMRLMEPIAQLGILPFSMGQGRNAPPSNEDIARVVVGALSDPGRHAGRTYRPTGPRLLSPTEIAGAYATVLARSVKYLDLPERMLLKALRALGVSPFEQSQLRYYMEDYRRNAFGVNAPTDAVREVGGTEPEPFEEVVRRYAAAMPEGRRTVGRQVKAAWNFARILFTPPLDLARVERDQGHPLIDRSEYAVDSPAWRAEHVPAGTGPAMMALPAAVAAGR